MIEVKNVTMHYGPVRALDSVSFTALTGRVLGLLGPNGAGKTTTMNIIAGHLVPDAGTVAVGGHDVLENPVEVRKLIGYLPEREPLYPDMEVAEFLRFVGKARGLRGELLKTRTQWVLDACSLRGVYRKLVGDLSRGYRQRVGLAQALIHDPGVLILDELTSGLDPLQTSEIRKLVRDLATGAGGAGKCIIFSTHVMQEAQAVSDHVVIINHGRIIADGEPDEIKAHASAAASILLTVEADRKEVEDALRALASVQGLDLIGRELAAVSYRITPADSGELRRELAETIKAKGWLVTELTPSKPSLEDAFLTLTRAAEGDSPASSPLPESEEKGEGETAKGGEVAQ